MLVVTRKERQVIVIGDDIRITICKVDGKRGNVRVGIEAPSDMPVNRLEVAERIAADAAAAATDWPAMDRVLAGLDG